MSAASQALRALAATLDDGASDEDTLRVATARAHGLLHGSADQRVALLWAALDAHERDTLRARIADLEEQLRKCRAAHATRSVSSLDDAARTIAALRSYLEQAAHDARGHRVRFRAHAPLVAAAAALTECERILSTVTEEATR